MSDNMELELEKMKKESEIANVTSSLKNLEFRKLEYLVNAKRLDEQIQKQKDTLTRLMGGLNG